MYNVRYRSHHDANRSLKVAFQSEESTYDYLKKTLNKPSNNRRVLYIHVPYCKKICSFCPFSKFSKIPMKGYDDYVIKDMAKIQNYPYIESAPFESVYFGGGTPTSLMPYQIDRILKYIRNNFQLEKDAEISLESSITELSDDMLEVLVNNGVNRLSIGVQTFNNKGRKLLNRRGTGEFAYERLGVIRKAIPNTNMDLIYNYPGQNLEELKEDINKIGSLDLAGISFYSLMIHDKTPLATKITPNEAELMKDLKREKLFFITIVNHLKEDGYELFELTKLIKNKRDRYRYIEAKHHNADCIPIGVKAGGKIGRYIHFNPETREDFDGVIRVSNKGRLVKEEYFKISKVLNELQHGFINQKSLLEVIDEKKVESFNKFINQLKINGLITLQNNTIQFTNNGYFFGNNIIDDIATLLISNPN